MLGKILTFIIVLGVIYLIFFKMTKRGGGDKKETTNFVECEKCGTFVEVKDAVLSGGKYICTDCMKLAKKG